MSSNTKLSQAELDALLQASKAPDSRDADVIPRLKELIQTANSLLVEVRCSTEDSSHLCNELIQALRVLRNSCAADEAVCSALLTFNLDELLADTIDALGAGAASLNWTLPAVTAQLLANFTSGSAACAAAAWHRLFPPHFTNLAHINSCPTQEAISLTLLTCCRVVHGAAQALVSPQGAPPITAMLHANSRLFGKGECNHTLALLLGHLAFQRDGLLPMIMSLSTSGEEVVEVPEKRWKIEDVEEVMVVAGHSLLLQELAVEAQDAPSLDVQSTELDLEGLQEEIEDMHAPFSGERGESMACLMALLRRFAARHAPSSSLSSSAHATPEEEDPLQETNNQHTKQDQLLQDVLHLLRDICARDDDGAALTMLPGTNGSSIGQTAPFRRSLVAELLTAKLIPTLPAMLKALGPIENPRRSQPIYPLAELSPALSSEAESYTSEQPYEGYRSDLLAVLANAACKRKDVQASVAACGGVELVLAQCQVDERSPLAREWALWAVRNLCEGSEAARDAIQELKACAAVDSEELKKAGVKVTLDEVSGKLRVEKREQSREEGDGI